MEIDTATGATTTIGPLGFDARFVGGLTVLNGTGYLVEGGDDASSLYTVNLYTGATSFVAHVSDPGFGITALTSAAPIPEPSTLFLVAAALTLAVARRRRR